MGFVISVSRVLALQHRGACAEQNLQDEKTVKSSYTGIPDSMLRHEYQVSPLDGLYSLSID